MIKEILSQLKPEERRLLDYAFEEEFSQLDALKKSGKGWKDIKR